MAERGAHLNKQTHENAAAFDRPSVFDILSQETLMSGLKPATRYLLKVCFSYFKNIIFLLIILQSYKTVVKVNYFVTKFRMYTYHLCVRRRCGYVRSFKISAIHYTKIKKLYLGYK